MKRPPNQGRWHWDRSNRACAGLALLILFPCSIGLAQQVPDYKAEQDWEQVCKHAEAQPLAPIQPAGPLSGDQLIKCDETAFYYGFGEEPNYPAALQCGWFQRAHP